MHNDRLKLQQFKQYMSRLIEYDMIDAAGSLQGLAFDKAGIS